VKTAETNINSGDATRIATGLVQAKSIVRHASNEEQRRFGDELVIQATSAKGVHDLVNKK
jgi:hypothetical protein